jgi:hypothetical protein
MLVCLAAPATDAVLSTPEEVFVPAEKLPLSNPSEEIVDANTTLTLNIKTKESNKKSNNTVEFTDVYYVFIWGISRVLSVYLTFLLFLSITLNQLGVYLSNLKIVVPPT